MLWQGFAVVALLATSICVHFYPQEKQLVGKLLTNQVFSRATKSLSLVKTGGHNLIALLGSTASGTISGNTQNTSYQQTVAGGVNQLPSLSITASVGATPECSEVTPRGWVMLQMGATNPTLNIASVDIYSADGTFKTAAALNQQFPLPNGSYSFRLSQGSSYILDPNSISTFDVRVSCGPHAVQLEQGEGTYLTPKVQYVEHGKSLDFYAKLLPGYNTLAVSGDGTWNADTGVFTTVPAVSNISVKSTAIANQAHMFTVTVIPGDGVIPSATTTPVKSGESVKLTLSLAPGYNSLTVNGGNGTLSGGTYYIPRVSSDLRIYASAKKTLYTIKASAGDGTTLTPSSLQVEYGKSATFTATLNSGYDNLVLSGPNGVQTGNTFTIGQVTADAVVTSSATRFYTVKTVVGAGTTLAFPRNGTVTTNVTEMKVAAGKPLTLTGGLLTGYNSLVLSGTMGTQSGDNFTIPQVTADVTVKSSATPNTSFHMVTAYPGVGTKLAPLSQRVEDGKPVTLDVSLLSGYQSLVVTAVNTNGAAGLANSVVTGTRSGNTYTIPAVHSDIIVRSSATRSLSVEEPFQITKSYPLDLNIDPTIFKNGVPVYKADGEVTMQFENPGDRAVIFVGTPSGWMSGAVYDANNGLSQVNGTTRWRVNFDTTRYADGPYRLAAAYSLPGKGWFVTDTLDFTIANNVVADNTTVAQTSATSGQQAYVKPTQYDPSWKPSADTQSGATTVTTFTPVLRLVVNNRQVTELTPSFDREELELRVTTMPARSVQFLAYAVDKAFTPAIKEIGKAGRDELLSRDGKEVWTFVTDMSAFPTGGFKLFARVQDTDGKTRESQPISVVVQHLNQLGATPASDVDVAVEVTQSTREEILQRVQDPGSCQNRQECQVFCSSTDAAQKKCTEFARAESKAPQESAIIEQIKKNQAATEAAFVTLLPEMMKRMEVVAANSTATSTAGATSTTGIAPSENGSTGPIAWVAPEYSGRPSIVDVMPTAVIEKIVEAKDQIVEALPEEVQTVADLQHYCGVVEHEENCTKAVERIAPEMKQEVERQTEVVRASEEHVTQLLEQRSGARSFIDSDGDGVSDFDEINFYHSDPAKRDTNGDGYSDGASLLGQTSPLDSSATISPATGKIVLGVGVAVENPKITGTTQSKQFAITTVAPLDLKEDEKGNKQIDRVVLRGTALPNSFVKVFLFSEPIVVTVKTDDNGNWSYILDKTLPDGAHTAYVAMADGGGRILAKSAPLPFVKEASAITVNAADLPGAPAKTGAFMGLSPLTLVALIIGVLGLSLSVVGVVIGIRHRDDLSAPTDMTPVV